MCVGGWWPSVNLRKVLERVAGEEGVRFTTSTDVEDIVTSCNGDVRHAMMKLQFQYGHRNKVRQCASRSGMRGGRGLGSTHSRMCMY